MILGNAISAIGVGISTILKEFTENRDKIETYLAMGASRFEACKPVAREALKLALLRESAPLFLLRSRSDVAPPLAASHDQSGQSKSLQ